MQHIFYLVSFILLFVIELIYFKIADKFNIVDKPNERSSHTLITLRGGGIIYWIASLFLFIVEGESGIYFFGGITLVSLISFWDDIKSLPNKLRLAVQLIALGLIFYNIGVFNLSIIIVTIAFILALGIINAYNFMDGVNGITGIYTLFFMCICLIINEYVVSFTPVNYIIYPILASLVFLFFNFRKKAKCFAGDVGSIAIAFWVIYLLSILILKTNSCIWLLLLTVYGVDTICTIIHRLYLRENIFKAHRLHLYQILCNEYKLDHRLISLLYGFIQLLVSSAVIILYIKDINIYLCYAIVVLPLTLLYLLKFKLIELTKINVK